VKDSDAILAYRAASAVEAYALVAHLEDEGIEARVLGEPLQGAYGGINAGGMNSVEVWISSINRTEAESMIDQWHRVRMTQSDEGQEQLGPEPPAKLQYSMLFLLWLMTAVAILAAATSLDLISLADWAGGMLYMALLTGLIQGFRKGSRRLASWFSRCTRDVPDPRRVQ
jgi:hypothetical protein